jgi:hypothetical protein
MLERLIWTFGASWLLGVTGVFVARGLFQSPPDSAPALLSASFWLVGGAGFLILSSLALGLETRGRAMQRSDDPRRR